MLSPSVVSRTPYDDPIIGSSPFTMKLLHSSLRDYATLTGERKGRVVILPE